jgi:hypothetical protein
MNVSTGADGAAANAGTGGTAGGAPAPTGGAAAAIVPRCKVYKLRVLLVEDNIGCLIQAPKSTTDRLVRKSSGASGR